MQGLSFLFISCNRSIRHPCGKHNEHIISIQRKTFGYRVFDRYLVSILDLSICPKYSFEDQGIQNFLQLRFPTVFWRLVFELDWADDIYTIQIWRIHHFQMANRNGIVNRNSDCPGGRNQLLVFLLGFWPRRKEWSSVTDDSLADGGQYLIRIYGPYEKTWI